MKTALLVIILTLLSIFAIAQAPVNDECAGRISISVPTGNFVTTATDLRQATESINSGCENAGNNNLDVWYEFTMAQTGNVRITNLGGFDNISLFSGCGGTELFCFVGNGFFYNLQGGNTYVLRIARRSDFADIVNFMLQAFNVLPNDECAGKLPITVTVGSFVATTVDLRQATESIDSSCEAASNENLDAWYEFAMPVTGNVRITNLGGFDSISLFDGCSGTEITCFYGDGFFYNLQQNITYVLRISRRSIFADPVTFRLQAFETLENDVCDDRLPIIVPVGSFAATTVDLRQATESTDSSCETVGNINLDAWYEFEMPITGNVRITNLGGFDSISLFNGCNGTEVTCFYGDGFFYNLQQNTTYVLRIARRSVFADSITFRMQAFAALANDECANSIAILVPVGSFATTTIDLRQATESTDSSCETAGNINLDAWYNFVMPVTGNVRITNLGGFDSISLFNGCNGTEVTCFYGDGFFYNLQQNTNYVLRVARRSVFADSVTFRMQAFAALANDECENATTLDVGVVNFTTVAYDLRAATESLDSSCETAGNTNLDLWYAFTMPVNGNISITNIGLFDNYALYDSCGGTELDCFNNNGLFFGLISGTTYLLRTSRRSIYADLITMRIQAIEAPLPTCSQTVEFINGNWVPNAPSETTNAIIRSNYNTATQGSFTACSLAVDANTFLRINSGDFIEISFGIDNNGTLIVEDQASLVQRDATSAALNNGNIRVEITTPFLKPNDFMILGSPMTAETRNGAFAAATMVRNHFTANFIPNAAVANDFPLAENFADDNGDNWVNYTGTINGAEGYLVRPQANSADGNQTYNLIFDEGTVNTGTISLPIIFNTSKNDSPNILSNPYPSAISVSDFISQNPTVDEVYFWEHLTSPNTSLPGYSDLNFSMEDISMYNLMGGIAATSDGTGTDTKPNGTIATAQGFGVKANAAGTALFTNQMRRASGNTTLRDNEFEANKIWLQVSNTDFNLQSSTLIGFSENTTAAIDAGYDSRRLANIVSLYSLTEDGTNQLGIQSRESFYENITVPLGFSTQIENDSPIAYVISLQNIEGIEIINANLYLVDNYLNTITDLTTSKYTFYSTKAEYNERFQIQFSKEVLSISTLKLDSISIYPNPANSFIWVKMPNNTVADSVAIFDISGRLLQNMNIKNTAQEFGINVESLSEGTYFIQLQTSTGSISKKFIKK